MQMHQAATSAYRDREFAELRVLTVADRVAKIARSHRPIYYFPEEFADIKTEELRKIAPVIRKQLAEKLAKAKKGKWHRLNVELKTV